MYEKNKIVFLTKEAFSIERIMIELEKVGFQASIFQCCMSYSNGIDERIHEPDIVVVDIDKYSDFELKSLSLRLSKLKQTKLLIMSAYDDIETRIKAARLKANSFLVKPLCEMKLIESIKKCLNLGKNYKTKVLVIDDDELSLKFCRKIMEHHSIRVRCLHDPFKVLEEIERVKPDVILLDYLLPNCHGVEIYRVIRQKYSDEEITVIFMTGRRDIDSLDDIMGESYLPPIMKPIDPKILIKAIEGYSSAI